MRLYEPITYLAHSTGNSEASVSDHGTGLSTASAPPITCCPVMQSDHFQVAYTSVFNILLLCSASLPSPWNCSLPDSSQGVYMAKTLFLHGCTWIHWGGQLPKADPSTSSLEILGTEVEDRRSFFPGGGLGEGSLGIWCWQCGQGQWQEQRVKLTYRKSWGAGRRHLVALGPLGKDAFRSN